MKECVLPDSVCLGSLTSLFLGPVVSSSQWLQTNTGKGSGSVFIPII